MFNDFLSNNFSILHINIRSINENFQSFKLFLSFLNFTFSKICFSEIWLDDSVLTHTLLYKLANHMSKHEVEVITKGHPRSHLHPQIFEF